MFTPKEPVIIDVYEGEYPVNLDGTYMCIMKASGKFTDGVRRKDRHVDDYYAECKDRGIKTGLYHLLRPHNIVEQADLFLSVWGELGGADLPPVVDVEIIPYLVGVGNSTWAYHIKTFLDRIQTGTGRIPMIYTSAYFWSFTSYPSWAKDYYLWAAWYPDFPDNFNFLPSKYIPKGWYGWDLWQYAENGRSNGWLANDYNMISPEFLKLLNEDEEPEPPTTDAVPTRVSLNIEMSDGTEVEKVVWP